tara:strand:- start:83 stop:469 length:387 start_codon:yes stop_codon:yes gene_type:complete
MVIVANTPKYWEFIRNLRNMDGVKQGFIRQEKIKKDSHKEYMKKYGDYFYICLDENKPIGYIGLIDNDIRVATIPEYHRKGVGTFMVNELIKICGADIVAKVKINNEASLKLFQRCGFKIKYYLLEIE